MSDRPHDLEAAVGRLRATEISNAPKENDRVAAEGREGLGSSRHEGGMSGIFDDAALRRLTMPVLLIVGGRDAMLHSHETKQRLEHAVRHASVCFLPDAGHILRDQAPRILAFLRGANERLRS